MTAGRQRLAFVRNRACHHRRRRHQPPPPPPVNRIFVHNAATTVRRGETRYRSRSHRGRISAKNTWRSVRSRPFLSSSLLLFFCFAAAVQARMFTTRGLTREARHALAGAPPRARRCLSQTRAISSGRTGLARNIRVSDLPLCTFALLALLPRAPRWAAPSERFNFYPPD